MKKHIPFLTALSILIIVLAGWKYSYFDFMTIDNSEDKVWVYLELKLNLANDTSDYFYYGQVKESIINHMDKKPSAKGFFKLYNIRYWNNDDLFTVYEDNYRLGYKVFRIEDIKQLQAYKKDPIFTFDEIDLHHSAKALRPKSDTIKVQK